MDSDEILHYIGSLKNDIVDIYNKVQWYKQAMNSISSQNLLLNQKIKELQDELTIVMTECKELQRLVKRDVNEQTTITK